jgi:hypothetical protein
VIGAGPAATSPLFAASWVSGHDGGKTPQVAPLFLRHSPSKALLIDPNISTMPITMTQHQHRRGEMGVEMVGAGTPS